MLADKAYPSWSAERRLEMARELAIYSRCYLSFCADEAFEEATRVFGGCTCFG